MPVILLVFVFLSAFSGLDALQTNQDSSAGFLVIRQDLNHRLDSFTLDGKWDFYWMRLLEPSDFLGTSNPATDWFSVPGLWNGTVHDGKTLDAFGYATFRLRFSLPATNLPLAISLFNMGTSYKLYLNGRLAASNGLVGTNAATTRPYLDPMIASFQPLPTNECVLQVANFVKNTGGPWNSIKAGTPAYLQRLRSLRFLMDGFFIGALALMFFYHIRLYLYRKAEISNFFFGLYALEVIFATLTNDLGEIRTIFAGIDYVLLTKLGYVTFSLTLWVSTSYIFHLYRTKNRQLYTRIYFGITLLAICLVSVLPFRYAGYCMYAMSVLTVVSMIHIIATLAAAARKKEDGAQINLIGYFLNVLALVHDALVAANIIWTQIYISSITMCIFLFLQSWILTRRLTAAFSLIETVSEKLEMSNTRLLTSLGGMEKELAQKTDLLKESERKFREMAILLPTILFDTDALGNISFINAIGQKAFGISADDKGNGPNFQELIREDQRERIGKYCHDVENGGETKFEEFTVKGAGGEELLLLGKAQATENRGLRWSAMNIKPLMTSVFLPNDSFFETYRFSPREKEVLLLLLQGMKSKDISQKLFITESTVKNHIGAIYAETGVRNKTEFFEFIRGHQAKDLGYESFIFHILSSMVKDA